MSKKKHIELLLSGQEIQIRPGGNSMTPMIKSKQLLTVSPITDQAEIKVGDVVYVKVGKYIYTHLVKALKQDKVLIGNNHGHLNGWTNIRNVYGKVTKIES